jgi:hypothetical protein
MRIGTKCVLAGAHCFFFTRGSWPVIVEALRVPSRGV